MTDKMPVFQVGQRGELKLSGSLTVSTSPC
jgi:hypothetical protein